MSERELASLRREAEAELAEPGRWGTTFTLIQSWGRAPRLIDSGVTRRGHLLCCRCERPDTELITTELDALRRLGQRVQTSAMPGSRRIVDLGAHQSRNRLVVPDYLPFARHTGRLSSLIAAAAARHYGPSALARVGRLAHEVQWSVCRQVIRSSAAN